MYYNEEQYDQEEDSDDDEFSYQTFKSYLNDILSTYKSGDKELESFYFIMMFEFYHVPEKVQEIYKMEILMGKYYEVFNQFITFK